jgi:hypothetical protein
MKNNPKTLTKQLTEQLNKFDKDRKKLLLLNRRKDANIKIMERKLREANRKLRLMEQEKRVLQQELKKRGNKEWDFK